MCILQGSCVLSDETCVVTVFGSGAGASWWTLGVEEQAQVKARQGEYRFLGPALPLRAGVFATHRTGNALRGYKSRAARSTNNQIDM
jgi:hypothetical protein